MLESMGNELAIRGAYMAIGGIGPNMTGPEGDKELYADLMKAVNDCTELLSSQEN